MASRMRVTLPFGRNKDKQIKFGLDSIFANDHDQRKNDELTNQLTKVKFSPPVKFQKAEGVNEVAPWKYENPHFDEQKETRLTKIIQKLIDAGIISEIAYTEPPKYLNSVDVIEIDNEFELNPDFRALNDENNFGFNIDKMPLKNYIPTKICSIPPSTTFSKLVIKDACYYFELDPNYRKYTTFKLRKGNTDHFYQFNTLHPNMDISFVHLQKQFERSFEILIDESIVKTFGHQILVLSKSVDYHIINLQKIFEHLSTALEGINLKISLKDSMVFFHEIEFLDFWLDGEGISISPRIKEQLKVFQSTSLENREWLRKFTFKYKNFQQKSEVAYDKRQEYLCENVFNKYPYTGYDKAVSFFQQAFLNSKKVPYPPSLPLDEKKMFKKPEKRRSFAELGQPSKSKLQKRSLSDLPQNLKPNQPQFQQPNLQQFQQPNQPQFQQPNLQQFQQPNLQQFQQPNLQQFQQPNLQQFQQPNPLLFQQPNPLLFQQPNQQYLLQYLQQMLQQNPLLRQNLIQIIHQFQLKYMQENPYFNQQLQQMTQEFMQQYPQQNAQQYLQLNPHVQQNVQQINQHFLRLNIHQIAHEFLQLISQLNPFQNQPQNNDMAMRTFQQVLSTPISYESQSMLPRSSQSNLSQIPQSNLSPSSQSDLPPSSQQFQQQYAHQLLQLNLHLQENLQQTTQRFQHPNPQPNQQQLQQPNHPPNNLPPNKRRRLN